MSAGFTPGPWVYRAGEVVTPDKGVRAGKIAEVAIAFKDSATRDANARLIAAAPELYEALHDALEVLYASGNRVEHKWIDALAKARGEQ